MDQFLAGNLYESIEDFDQQLRDGKSLSPLDRAILLTNIALAEYGRFQIKFSLFEV